MNFPLDIFFGGFVTGAGVALGISILAGLLLRRRQAAPKPKPRKTLDINRLILGPKIYKRDTSIAVDAARPGQSSGSDSRGFMAPIADESNASRREPGSNPGCSTWKYCRYHRDESCDCGQCPGPKDPGMRLQPIKPESHLARQVGSLGERGTES